MNAQAAQARLSDAESRSWFTLRFRSDESERVFREELAAELRPTWRIFLVVAIGFTIVGGAPEISLLEPEHFWEAAALRYGLLLGTLVASLALSYTPAFPRLMSPALTAGLVICSGALTAIGTLYPQTLHVPGMHGLEAVPIGSAKFVFPQLFFITVSAGCVSTGALRFRGSLVFGASIVPTLIASGLVNRPKIDEVFYSVSLSVVGLLVSSLGAYRMEALRRSLFRQKLELELEQDRTLALLHNTLPSSIARRLEREEVGIADEHAEVTVLFSDIVGFTPLAASEAPATIVDLLNRLFSRFDEIAERRGLEKIKTIGDAYMVVGGAPEPRADAAEAIAEMALEMRAVANETLGPDGKPLRLRLGIHSGPVIAGVIGITRRAYDLWGDTVNTASRMESHGEPGCIQVTEAVEARLAGAFLFEPRGVVEIKGVGPMRTFYLTGPARREDDGRSGGEAQPG